MNTLHLDGHPINASTYRRHGCRCSGCTAANTHETNVWRARHPDKDRAQKRRYHARRAAAWRWVVTNRPDVAAQIEKEIS